ncbi:MAG: phosphatidate cytidylyltransferase [Rhodospirillaceae bacterium]
MNGEGVGLLLRLIGALFLAGGVGIGAAWLIPATRAAARPFLPLFAQEVLIVAPVAALALLPGGWAWALLSLFIVRGGWELAVTARTAPQAAVPLVLFGLWSLAAAALAGFALAVGAQALVLLVYLTVEGGDSAALLVGRLIGRIHPFPHLSPRKTLAGCVAGVAAAWGLGIAGGVAAGLPPSRAVIAAGAAALAGLAGDLSVSAVKRAAGVKDFPPVLARHGGVLDIYDSFVFGLPAAILALALTT